MKLFSPPAKVSANKGGQTTQRKTQPPKTLVDNRSSTVLQRKLQQSINASPRVLQAKFGKGLPEELKANLEAQSGYSLDDVTVHYNSNKPAKVGALAYAQGTDIYLSAGQEKHLAHEAWHVVQQKQGRVRPTLQLEGGAAINDSISLEQEAERMGLRASFPIKKLGQQKFHQGTTIPNQQVAQLFKEEDLLFTNEGRGKYAILKDSKRYELYGRTDTTGPQPTDLYREETVFAEDTKGEFKRWTPIVCFIQGRDYAPDTTRSPQATLSWPERISNPLSSSILLSKKQTKLNEQDLLQDGEKLRIAYDQLPEKLEDLCEYAKKFMSDDSLAVIGKNDCARWALALQTFISFYKENSYDPIEEKESSYRPDEEETLDKPKPISYDLDKSPITFEFSPGDRLEQLFNTPTCPYHGATIVAMDKDSLITLEAHVSKDIEHPQFHFYKGLQGFISANNIGPDGTDYQTVNGRRGTIMPLESAQGINLEYRKEIENILYTAERKFAEIENKSYDNYMEYQGALDSVMNSFQLCPGRNKAHLFRPRTRATTTI